MKKDKYFVVSDIHSFSKELIDSLKTAGFNRKVNNHKLVVLGDVFDRGPDSLGVYEFLKSIKQNNLILIGGNHEELYLKLLGKSFPDIFDFNNGTVRTFCQIAYPEQGNDFEEQLFYYFKNFEFFKDNYILLGNKIKSKIKKHKITKWLMSDSGRMYFELDNFIFTHSFIPDDKDGRKLPTDSYLGNKAIGSCPGKQYLNGKFNAEKLNNKILVCGHGHTSDFHKHLGLNLTPSNAIFYGKNVIAIDAGIKLKNSALMHKQNVLIIAEDICYDENNNKLINMEKAFNKKIYKDDSKDEDYYLALENYSNIDYTHCELNNCQTPCLRRVKQQGIYTAADFSNICKSFCDTNYYEEV